MKFSRNTIYTPDILRGFPNMIISGQLGGIQLRTNTALFGMNCTIFKEIIKADPSLLEQEDLTVIIESLNSSDLFFLDTMLHGESAKVKAAHFSKTCRQMYLSSQKLAFIQPAWAEGQFGAMEDLAGSESEEELQDFLMSLEDSVVLSKMGTVNSGSETETASEDLASPQAENGRKTESESETGQLDRPVGSHSECQNGKVTQVQEEVHKLRLLAPKTGLTVRAAKETVVKVDSETETGSETEELMNIRKAHRRGKRKRSESTKVQGKARQKRIKTAEKDDSETETEPETSPKKVGRPRKKLRKTAEKDDSETETDPDIPKNGDESDDSVHVLPQFVHVSPKNGVDKGKSDLGSEENEDTKEKKIKEQRQRRKNELKLRQRHALREVYEIDPNNEIEVELLRALCDMILVHESEDKSVATVKVITADGVSHQQQVIFLKSEVSKGPDGEFLCSKCKKKFKDWDFFCHHGLNAHSVFLKLQAYGLSEAFKDRNDECVCFICDKKLQGWNFYHRHVLNVHNTSGLFECGLCPLFFEDVASRIKHWEEHFPNVLIRDEAIVCPQCSVPFSFKVKKGLQHRHMNNGRVFKKHLVMHDKPVMPPCIACGFLPPKNGSKTVRYEQHYKEYLPIRFKRHARLMGPGHDNKCAYEDCSAPEFSSWDEHQEHLNLMHGGVFKWKCGYCKVLLATKPALELHLREKHPAKPSTKVKHHICEFCGKAYDWPAMLANHIKSAHHDQVGKEEWVCEICGKSLLTKWKLRYHIRSHENAELTIECKECGKTFKGDKRNQLLNGHVLNMHVPEEEKDIECEICGKRFGSKRGIYYHMKTHEKKVKKER